MAGFKVGDRVRLKQPIAGKTSQQLKEQHKGQVTEVTGETTYVVQFDDTKAAVEGISEEEIERDA